MKEPTIKSYDELPLFLSAKHLEALLGISRSAVYKLMNSEGFPMVRIAGRLMCPKDSFQRWVEANMEDVYIV